MTSVPNARNGPKGIFVFRPLPRAIIRKIPKTAPVRLASLEEAGGERDVAALGRHNLLVPQGFETVIAHLATYKVGAIALPVVDQAGVLLGIVTIDDVFDVEEAEATEDMQKFSGQASLEDSYLATEKLVLIRKRLGWLTLLFIGGLVTSKGAGLCSVSSR